MNTKLDKQAALSAEDSTEDRKGDRVEETAFSAPVRLRAWLIGVPLLVALSVLSVYADMSAQVIQFGVLQFSPPALVALCALGLLNGAARRLTGKTVLRRSEMLVIYAMLLVGVMVSTRGVTEKVVGSIAIVPYIAANGEPNWNSLLLHLPRWSVPYDPARALPIPETVRAFYEGNHGRVPWHEWFGPLLADFGLVAAVILIFLGMATVFRRQWVDIEHLSFPLTSIPIAIISDEFNGKPLFSNRLFWLGVLVSTGLYALNGMAANYPTIPSVSLNFDCGSLLTVPPWNSIGFFHAFFSMAVIGFAYFIPGDMLLSMWFFYFLVLLQPVVGSDFGYSTDQSNRFANYQTAGTYLMLAGAIFWQARLHLADVWRTALAKKGRGPLDDSGELMRYRAALLAVVVGFGLAVTWLCVAGMSVAAAAFQIGIYVFVTALVMTRAVAQAGLLITETNFVPLDIARLFIPDSSLGPANLTWIGVTDNWFARDLRGELLAPFLDTQRTAGQLGVRPRTLLVPLVVAVVVSLAVASAAFLHLHYVVGGNLLYSHPKSLATFNMNRAVNAIHDLSSQGVSSPQGFFTGAVSAVLLTVLRSQQAWFPLHPLGLAVAHSWAMSVCWAGFLLAWMIRSLVTRIGGIKLYRHVAPLMLGLIIGEFSSAVFWVVLHMALNTATPEMPWP